MANIYQHDIGGRTLTIEIGDLAGQADGACLVRYLDTVVLVTATKSQQPREGVDFFPLSVDFVEKQYSAGKIPGGFIRREGRPSEKAILTSRLIDRPIRPLFPKEYRNDVQVVATVLSVDQNANPDTVAMIGSSVALSISSVPFDGPTGSVSIGYIDGNYIINPNSKQREVSQMYLVVSGTKDAIMMVEAGAKEVSEEVMLDGILFAHEEIKKICEFIDSIVQKEGKEKEIFIPPAIDEDLMAQVLEFGENKMTAAIKTKDKLERMTNMDAAKEEIMSHFEELYPDMVSQVDQIVYKMVKNGVRNLITKDKIRPDNRLTTEIRPIWSKVSLLPRTHGSAVFTRGQTQVLSITTLGALSESQTIDGIGEETEKRYMHQYNFPAFSVGDTKPSRSPGRREIGHGALGEKALLPVIPSKEDFPYTIRVVSEVLSSNGSTSQASVCGSCLSLMDAGVPIKNMVAGIAMGLIKEKDDITILSDIQGMEDFLGDMDFKVAGTENGITAIQMDIKIEGINKEILQRALAQARDGRLFILGEMRKTLSEPRKELSKYAPKIMTISIKPEKIGEVIGSGGKTINKIIEETGVKIDIDENGLVCIMSEDLSACDRAKAIIESIIEEPEVGKTYKGKIVKITTFGAFVEILKGKEGLCHISQLDKKRVNKVEDLYKIGDEIEVKLTEIDAQGRINLSRKALLK